MAWRSVSVGDRSSPQAGEEQHDGDGDVRPYELARGHPLEQRRLGSGLAIGIAHPRTLVTGPLRRRPPPG